MSDKKPIAWRVEPYSQEYCDRKFNVMECFCPEIYPCADCGNPVVQGYCCTNCKSAIPSEKGNAQLKVKDATQDEEDDP